MALKVELCGAAAHAIRRMDVTPECVAEAVRSPDDVRKILPDGNAPGDWPVISLYLKRLPDGTEGSLLLVQGLKQGGTVTASAVWRVHPGDIGVAWASATALEVFEAFVEKYGIQLKTARGLTKLMTYQVVASSTASHDGRWQRTFALPENVLGADDRRVTQTPEVSLTKWARRLNVKMHVAMLYAVNLSNYLHDLAAHRGAMPC